ncbi:MAG TPA: DUF6150 family protein [Bacteroidia bacterium]|nr:DUF6150 family protein [Bacteroidia bacterium]
MNILPLLLLAYMAIVQPLDRLGAQAAVDPCQLQGAVFVEEVEAFATYRVYLEDVENFADLRVFKESVRGFADKPGRWHFTDTKAFADFTVAFVNVRARADFSIYYTEFQSLSGCR